MKYLVMSEILCTFAPANGKRLHRSKDCKDVKTQVFYPIIDCGDIGFHQFM